MSEFKIEPLLVTVPEAARMLALSRSLVYEMIANGELPSVKYGGTRRIAIATIKEWIANHTTGKRTNG